MPSDTGNTEIELGTYKKLSNKYILDLGYHTAGTIITLRANKEQTLHMTAYSFDEEYFADLIQDLSKSTMQITLRDSDSLSGTITADQDGYLILSIPYDPGFAVLVDGVITEVSLFEDMMIAVPIAKGSHTISLSYYPQGMTAGIFITILSILLFTGICFFERRQNRSK